MQGVYVKGSMSRVGLCPGESLCPGGSLSGYDYVRAVRILLTGRIQCEVLTTLPILSS